MKIFHWIAIILLSMPLLKGLDVPDDIVEGIRKSRTLESGGLVIDGVDRDRMLEYVRLHWRDILDQIESFPEAHGDFSGNKQNAINASVIHFGAICESLPPEEYVEFLEKFIGLVEEGKIQYFPLIHQLMASTSWKDCFLQVNYSHPKVQAFLQRAMKVIPESDPDMLAFVKLAADGELADTYLTNRSDDFRPQTLPGVKLKRPWGSLIRAYERMTGEKAPPDPEFPEDEPRTARRPGFDEPDASVEYAMDDESFWLLTSLLLLGCAGGFYWYRRRKKYGTARTNLLN